VRPPYRDCCFFHIFRTSPLPPSLMIANSASNFPTSTPPTCFAHLLLPPPARSHNLLPPSAAYPSLNFPHQLLPPLFALVIAIVLHHQHFSRSSFSVLPFLLHCASAVSCLPLWQLSYLELDLQLQSNLVITNSKGH